MKKIYLDWSHLQNIIDKDLNASETILLNNNQICFSFSHLADISRGMDRAKVLKRAKSLDLIPNKLFLKDADVLQTIEVVRSLELGILGRKYVPDSFFANINMYDLFNLSQIKDSTDVKYIIENSNFEKYFEDVLNEKGFSLVNHMYDRSYEMSQEIALDRKFVISQNLQSQLEIKRNKNIRNGLNFYIGNALFVLHLNGLSSDRFIYKANQFYLSVNDKFYSLNDHFMIHNNLKFYHLFNEYMFLKGNSLSKKNVTSKNFQSTKSDIADYAHLHALIYCDIVTCDNLNYDLLINAAKNLNLDLQNLKKIEDII